MHVIWISITLTEIGLVVTELIGTLLIGPSLTVLSESEWLREASFWAHMPHVVGIGVAVTKMSLEVTSVIRTFWIFPSLAIDLVFK
jgi:hypothetical protein